MRVKNRLTKRRQRKWLEQAIAWALVALMVIAVSIPLLFYGGVIVVGGMAGAEHYAFEHRATPVAGQVVGRYIITCAYGPCFNYPANDRVIVRPDLAGSRAFDAEYCRDRTASGGRRARGSIDQGPCRHTIVTAFRIGDALRYDYEATTPRFYWENWDADTLPLLVDPDVPADARIRDSGFDLHFFHLALITITSITLWLAFEWLKARTWDPWRMRVKRRKRDRERRSRAKLAKQSSAA